MTQEINSIDKASADISDVVREMEASRDEDDLSRDDLFCMVVDWEIKLYNIAKAIR